MTPPISTIQKHRRRQLLLASCTIAFFALLTSTTFLQTQLQYASNNNYSNFHNTNNNVTSASCGRWIDSQRPSSHRRDQEEETVAGSVITAELTGANDEKICC